MDPSQQQQQQKDDKQHVILFYKYHPLSDDPSVTEQYRLALHNLCRDLGLTGRILVGCSSTSEGINGTLAGPHGRVKAFTVALSDLQKQQLKDNGGDASDAASRLERAGIDDPQDRRAVQEYWTASREFFDRLGAPVLALHADDFKWSAAARTTDGSGGGDYMSASADAAPLFPDLNVKLVDELIGSGGAMKDVPIQETSQGYLTPDEWHEAISRLDPHHSVLIDCRNNKEYEIGHFAAAVNPHTTVYSQFPHWVAQNQHLMENKTVYMYCTGALVAADVGIALDCATDIDTF
jgi:predicted sulfurtransferase